MRILRRLAIAVAIAAAAQAQSPIPVSNFAELCKIADDLGGDYELVNNITVTRAEISAKFGTDGFEPIGTESRPFTGTFRGKDRRTYTIYGLYINRPKSGDVGLFGYVGAGAEISNIGVVADTVIGLYSVGTLAGTNKGLIVNCYGGGVVRAPVSGTRAESCAGGLVGYNGGTIEKSYSGAEVEGNHYVGGLTGFLTVAPAGRIYESYATGEVSGHNYAGGLAGYIFGGVIEKCFSTGKVIGLGERSTVGGLAGSDFSVLNASWSVRGKNGTGNYIKPAEIKNSFWDKKSSGQSSSAGGTGKTTEEMMDSSTFSDWDGFDTAWRITQGVSYPLLHSAPICTLTYRAGFNGRLMTGGVILPRDNSIVAILEEGSKGPEVTVVPDERHNFDGWTDRAGDSIRADIALKGAPVNVTAQFSPKSGVDMCNLTYQVESGHELWGTLRVDAAGVKFESSKYSMTVARGAMGFEVMAVPAEGCVFVGWDNGSTGSVRSDASIKDAVFTAMFAKTYPDPNRPGVYWPFLYSSGAGGQLRKSGSSNLLAYIYEEPVLEGSAGPLVAAVPDAGSRFVRWNDGAETLLRSDRAVPYATYLAIFEEAAGTPIPISGLSDLQKIGSDGGYPMNGRYILMNDIDGSSGFTPVGSRENPFTGTFDGNGKTITGLRISRSGGNGVGLFGYAKNARISRVYLTGASVTGGNNVGALVGVGENTIIDSCGVGGMAAGADSVGGLVGKSAGSVISRSYSTAVVIGRGAAGGLAGAATGSMITHCYAAGNVEGTVGVGGIVGSAEGGVAQYSYAVGNISGTEAAGGFAGDVSRGAEFYQCYSTGYVDGSGSKGGFAGASGTGGGTAVMCYWDSEVSEQETSAGGLGLGRGTMEMMYAPTYVGWDFAGVWGIKNSGKNYPHLQEVEPEKYPGMYKPRQASARQAGKRLLKVRGRVMTINAPQGAAWLIRVVDMKGKTVARYDTRNGTRISLNKIPPGRYMVEARNRGKRAGVSGLVVK